MKHLGLGPGHEFDAIRRIHAVLGPRMATAGDDCVEIPEEPGRLVASTDVAIEGLHFHREWLTLEEIGFRAAAGAFSDLGAAGARAVGVLAAVVVPAGTAAHDAEHLMLGVGECAAEVGAKVLGGDLSRGPGLGLALTVFGRAERVMSRKGAKPGDGLWVTGVLGGARAALCAWLSGGVPDPLARMAFAHPVPRTVAGQWLAEHGASAMMDLSDGLAGDVRHLAAASGVGITVDLGLVPLHPSVVVAARVETEPAPAFAAVGGEDYELLVTLPEEFTHEQAARLHALHGVPLTRIGTVDDTGQVRLRLDGRDLELTGWDHFR